MAKSFYDVLGVSKDASADEIKSAYRKLARQYHPDLHPGDEEAANKFKEISEAYDKLTDRDIQDGALYLMLGADCFSNNDLIRQNRYWNRRSN